MCEDCKCNKPNPNLRMILSIIFWLSLLAFIYFAFCNNPAHAISMKTKPQNGDYVCWYSSVKDNSCGTFGYDRNKKLAMNAGESLCLSQCDKTCQLEYCEKLGVK